MRPPCLTGTATAYRTESCATSKGRITPESERLPACTISGFTAGMRGWGAALSPSDRRCAPPGLTSSTSPIC